MAVLAYDEFSGTTGTALTSHTATSGQSWAMHPATGSITGTTPPTLNGSGGVVGASSSTFVLALLGLTPGSADYMAQGKLADSALPSTAYARLWIRADPAASTGYYVQLESRGAGAYRLDLYKSVAGTATLLASTTNLTLTGTDALYMAISASGSTITGYWQTQAAIAGSGWITCTATDASIGGVGQAGLMLRSDAANQTFSDFRVQDVGTAYNATLPASASATSSNPLTTGTTTLTLSGTGTAWAGGMAWHVTGSVSGNLDASITATNVASATSTTITFTNPTTPQTLTITNSVDATAPTVAVTQAATTLAISGPTVVSQGIAYTYTVTANPAGGGIDGTATVTPTDGGKGGVFSPATVSVSTAAPSASYTYTPATTGTIVLSCTNTAANPTLANGTLPILAANNDIATGTPVFTPTYHKIAIRLPYAGDANESATCTISFRKTGSGDAWRNCLGNSDTSTCTRLDKDGSGNLVANRYFLTCVLLASPGTPYDVQIAVVDPDGGGSTTVYAGGSTAGLTTLADDIPDAASLVATKFVDSVNGNDAWDGTSATFVSGTTGPWRTFGHACAAVTAGDVVDFAAGWYQVDGTTVCTVDDVVFRAHNPAATGGLALVGGRYVGQMQPANAGSRCVCTNSIWSSPTTATTDANPGPWVKCDGVGGDPAALVGPATGASYSNVWRWRRATAWPQVVKDCGYVATGTKTDVPLRTLAWTTADAVVTGGWTLTTPGGFAEIVNTNQTYQYGIWNDPSNKTDMYLRLPDDINPNTCWIFFSETDYSGGIGNGVYLQGANQRVTGFEFRYTHQGVTPYYTSSAGIVDHCLFEGNTSGVNPVSNKAVTPNLYGDLLTVEYNYFHDTNQWDNANQTDPHKFGWNCVKSGFFLMAAAPGNGQQFVKKPTTGQVIPYSSSGDPSRLVFRYNTIINGHDMIAMGNDPTFDQWGGYASDIYQNYRDQGMDDGPEFTGPIMNAAVWGNFVGETLTGCSFNAVSFGPIYYFRNTHWRYGSAGQIVDMGCPTTGNQDTPVPGGTAIKWGSTTSNPYPWVIMVHNTWWTDDDTTVTNNAGQQQRTIPDGPFPSGGQTQTVHFYLRNNVWATRSYFGAVWPPNTTLGSQDWLNEDANQYACQSLIGTPKVQYGLSGTATTTVAQWRSVSGEGAHDQPILGVGGNDWNLLLDSQFAGPTVGNLSLVAASGLIDAGVQVANISDLALPNGADLSNGGYYGAAPSLGAVEFVPAVLPIACPDLSMMGLGT